MAKTKTKATAKKSYKATPSRARRTKGAVLTEIAGATELSRKQVGTVFETLSTLIAADLSKGCGEFNFMGLLKLKTVKKPATKARQGVNPFTGQQIMIKAKPASRKVRARALSALNNML
ncbi:MAG: HU family DNA-binding protein [Planctomycetota bacterium]|nr:HU family DNA-binding protein [Planctomycetota bacterium]